MSILNISIFNKLLAEALALGWVDWAVTMTALLYVVLAARQNVWGWAWGIVSCGLWAYASFFFYRLWLDALLQLFYVVMGFVGIYKWIGKSGTQGRSGGMTGSPRITMLTYWQHIGIILSGSAIAWLFGYFFDVYTPAAATYLDAFVTVFSVVATFLLVQKKLDNWAYWVVIDGVSVYLFASRGAYLFAFIMLAYTIIATNAFWQWRKSYQVSQYSA